MLRFFPHLHPILARSAAAVLVIGVALLAYRAYAWPGVALAAGGVVMWVLLSMTRMLTVLKRAAQRPIGSVGSAVMFHARLESGLTMLQLLAFAGAMGQRLPNGDAQDQPVYTEQYQWTDTSDATVLCILEHGKLVRWSLTRP